MNKGFSFIEILIVIAILAIIAVLTAVGFSSFYRKQTLDSLVDQVVSLVNEARQRTLFSDGDSQYGIHFEGGRVVLFKGISFTEPSPNNKEFIFSSFIEINNISLNGGGADLIFERLTGKTNEYGAISFRIRNDILKTKTITIEKSGAVSIN